MKNKPLRRYWNGNAPAPGLVSFLGIPKAASSSVRAAIGADPNKDWTEQPAHPTTFTVLRCPVERTISAYFECVRRGTMHGTFDVFIDVLDRRGPVFDPHVFPQADYFEPVEQVFSVENIHLLWSWLGVPAGRPLNVTPDCRRPVITKRHLNVIFSTYEQDFLLYERLCRPGGGH